MRRDRRLIFLVMAHLTLWLVSAVLAPVEVYTPFGLENILVVPFFALTFSQVSLLGLWAVFSRSRPWYRLLGPVVIGTACLEAAFDRVFELEFLLMPTAAMIFTLISLIVLRRFGLRLSLQADEANPTGRESERFRFSIRGLMVLTAVVALLSAVAREVQGSSGPFSPILSVVWSACFVAVSLLTLWAARGPGVSLRRGSLTVAVSAVLGVYLAYIAEAHRDGWVYIITIMLLYPAVLLGSPRVVRSYGYHLVWRPVPRARPLEPTLQDPGDADHDRGRGAMADVSRDGPGAASRCIG